MYIQTKNTTIFEYHILIVSGIRAWIQKAILLLWIQFFTNVQALSNENSLLQLSAIDSIDLHPINVQ